MKFREINNNDIEVVRRWLIQPHVTKWFKLPNAWIDEITKRETKFNFIKHFIVEDNNKSIGFCQYYDYSQGGENWHGNFRIDNIWSIDYLIGEEDYLGKGYGTLIVKELTRKIKENTNAKEIIVQPEKENIISQNTLLSAGYQYDEQNDLYYYEIN